MTNFNSIEHHKHKKTKHAYFNRRIILIKGLFNLRLIDVANITGHARITVASWLCDPDKPNYRKAPEEAFKALSKIYSLEYD